jgi:hypothetical protein
MLDDFALLPPGIVAIVVVVVLVPGVAATKMFLWDRVLDFDSVNEDLDGFP